MVVFMCYYIMPLSTLVTIVRTRSAASIYPPLAVASIANGSLWTIYGFTVRVRSPSPADESPVTGSARVRGESAT